MLHFLLKITCFSFKISQISGFVETLSFLNLKGKKDNRDLSYSFVTILGPRLNENNY